MDHLLSWLFAFLLLFFVLSLVGYQIICLTDLEVDYINQYDAADRINKVVLPEFVSQGVLCFIYLVTGCWCMFLLSLPYLVYNIRLWKRNQYLIDVTEIYNNLKREKDQRLFKLYYLILLVVIAIFCSLLIAKSPSNAGFGLDQGKGFLKRYACGFENYWRCSMHVASSLSSSSSVG
ncbi:hypothetical protein BT93_D1344 [Corymbia citriodora subsp. variegata]|nr:hypothetical protein BT93_D1344 [Corymbia citriodora subsp. variegata]